MTLESGQTRLQVHKIIFANSLGDFHCLGRSIHGASGVFEVKEWPTQLVERMVEYMYIGNYGDWPADIEEQTDVDKEQQTCF
ncbi:hypothetical protein ACQRIT_004342 [Beauveria bassiana]